MEGDQFIIFCRDLVRARAHDIFLCILLSPKRVEHISIVVHALNIEISKIFYSIEDALVANVKMHWWKDQVSRLKLSSDLSTHVLGHPVLASIKNHILKLDENADLLEEYMNGNIKFINKNNFLNINELEEYLSNTIFVLFKILFLYCTGKSAIKNTNQELFLYHTAMAKGIVDSIRNEKNMEKRSGSFLATEMLDICGIEDIPKDSKEHEKTVSLIVKDMIKRAESHMDRATALQKYAPGTVFHIKLSNYITSQNIDKIKKNKFKIDSYENVHCNSIYKKLKLLMAAIKLKLTS